jgi:hypothetical protein
MPAESTSQTSINLGDQDNSHFRVQLWTSGGHLKWELDIRNGNRQPLYLLKPRVIWRSPDLRRCESYHAMSSSTRLKLVSLLQNAATRPWETYPIGAGHGQTRSECSVT